MKQVTYVKPGVIETRDVPPPEIREETDVLVRPLAVATCDIDAAVVRGRTPLEPPFPLGHECVAEVSELGAAVDHLQRGDRVCIPFQISCGRCMRCRAGLTGFCEGHGGDVPGLQWFGLGPTGRTWGGMLSELVRVPFAEHMLVALPAGASPEALASLGDCVVDGWRTVAEPLRVHPGAPVLVVGGSGAIALYAVAAALALDAESVMYIDSVTRRLEKAERLGATAIDRGAGWPSSLGPYPITVDSSGSAKGLTLALRSTDHGGVCTSTGIWKPFEVSLDEMYFTGLTFVTGVIQARASMPSVLELVLAGRLDPSLVIDRILGWDDATDALPELSEKLVFSRQA